MLAGVRSKWHTVLLMCIKKSVCMNTFAVKCSLDTACKQSTTDLQQLHCDCQHACLLPTSCKVGLGAQRMMEVGPLQQPANDECVKDPSAGLFVFSMDSNLLQNQTQGPIRASTNLIELDHPRHQQLLCTDESYELIMEEEIIKSNSLVFHLFHGISHLCFHIVVSESSKLSVSAGGGMKQATWLQ